MFTPTIRLGRPPRDAWARGPGVHLDCDHPATSPASRWSVGRRESLRRTTPITRSLIRSRRRRLPVSPTIGIGPGPVIASDNTLGAFSQFQGKLYVAFVGVHWRPRMPQTSNANPAGNTEHLPGHLDHRRHELVVPGPGQPGQRGDGRVLRRECDQAAGSGQHERPDPVHAVDRRGPGNRHARGELFRHPQRCGERAVCHLHDHQHRWRPDSSRPIPSSTRPTRPSTRSPSRT